MSLEQVGAWMETAIVTLAMAAIVLQFGVALVGAFKNEPNDRRALRTTRRTPATRGQWRCER